MKAYIKDRNLRRFLLLLLDIVLINVAALISLKIAFNFQVTPEYIMIRDSFIKYLPHHTAMVIGSFYLFGLYSSLWHYASIKEMLSIISGSIFAMVLTFFIFFMIPIHFNLNVYIINTFLLIMVAGLSRLSYRMGRIFKVYYGTKRGSLLNAKTTKVLIVGAGEAGVMAFKEIENHTNTDKIVIGFLDDDKRKIGHKIMGLPVFESIDNIDKLMKYIHIDEVILAIPCMNKVRKKEILEKYKHLNIELNIVPPLYEILDGKLKIGGVRKVKIEDLLGRDPISLDNPEIAKYIKDRTVLVTGGGGSIGSEICRQITMFKPKLLIIFDIYENNAYDIQNELKMKYGDQVNLKVLIGSVREKDRLEEVFSKYRPNLVFHAAAHKHVPLMQDSPFEAIKNNSIGTVNTAEMAGEYGADRFVLISTDKAVNPTNIMGASKRLAELGLQCVNDKYEDTELMVVRFGNVLGSNGSVIPLFTNQIEAGGPVLVTHPDIIRYFMTIPEAVELVLQAGSMAMGGEVFVLDMGDPVKIVDLAKDLIRLSGYEPYDDIDIEFVGLRPGEKLFEELLLDEENLKRTPYKKIFVIGQSGIELEHINEIFIMLNKAIKERDLEYLEDCITDLIPNYRKIEHAKE